MRAVALPPPPDLSAPTKEKADWCIKAIQDLSRGSQIDSTQEDIDSSLATTLTDYSTSAVIAAGYQPLDADLTSIAALTTTAYGRAFLEYANLAAVKSDLGVTANETDISAIQTALNTVSSFGSWHIEYGDDKEYVVIQNSPVAFDITEVTAISASGSCTVTVSINGTNLGGSANTVTTSEDIEAHSSANSVSVGDNVEITISSNSLSEGVVVTMAVNLDILP